MRVITLFVFSIFCLIAYTQEYEVLISNVTDERGIDVPATFGIAEDIYGFIWFGTVDGLYRYDGHRMKIYRNIPGDTNTLSNNTIRAIVVDSVRNILWIGTQGGGLNAFDLESGLFTRYEHDPLQAEGLSNNSIWELMLDSEGFLWIGMENNYLNRFEPETQAFTDVSFDSVARPYMNSCAIRMLYNDVDGNVWVGTDNNGLYQLSKNQKIKHYHDARSGDKILENNFVISALEDEKYIWIATYGAGIGMINKLTGRLEHVKANSNKSKGPISNLTYALLPGKSNEIWVGTEYGLSLIDKATGQAKHYVQSGALVNDLTDNRIRILFKDSNGIIWVGTEAGVDKLVRQKNFKIYRNSPNTPNSISAGIVRALCKDDAGNLWMGIIDKGLVKYNSNTNQYTIYSEELKFGEDLICYQISALFEDSRGVLWVGDWEQGLLMFDQEKEKFIPVLSKTSQEVHLKENRIQVIKEASPGVLWLGTEKGLHRYNYLENKMDYILNDPKDSTTISGNSIQSAAFEIDDKGNLWVGTWSKGLNYLEILNQNPLEYKVTRYLQPNNQQWLNNSNVISLYLQDSSALWIGAFGGGLMQMNTNTGELISYDTEDGLPNNTIFTIAGGRDGSLWLSTDFGLSNFVPSNLTFHNYEKSDGLQDNHFFWGASFTADDGEQFFGGIAGVNSFYPEKILTKDKTRGIYATEIIINNEPYEGGVNPEVLSDLELSYKQNHLSIGFTILNYAHTHAGKVQARLLGLDDEWFNMGSQRNLNYSNLRPGTYFLEIKVIGSHNLTQVTKSILRLHIAPPWWKTWWARILEVLIITVILYIVYQLRLRMLLQQKRKLLQLVKESTSEVLQKNIVLGQQNEEIRTQKEELASTFQKLSEAKEKVIQAEKMASIGILAAGVAHEINNPLNFIKGGVLGIEQHFSENECGESENSQLFLRAIKEGVDRTSAIVKSLNEFSKNNEGFSDECNLGAIIDNCLVILRHQLKDKVEVKLDLLTSGILITGNSGKLHQVFLNVLSNAEQAIPGKGLIEIESQINDSSVKIIIKDSGTGIKSEDLNRVIEPFFTTKDPGKGTGLGLSVSYKIIKEHDGDIAFESEYGKGTSVAITLPVMLKD